MASMLASQWPRLLTVEEFLQIDFGPELKAELDNGIVRMMAGGTRDHARVQMNLYRFLGNALRGSRCRPFGSDMGVQTRELGMRYPDVSVDCGRPGDNPSDRVLGNPKLVVEVLSPSTRDHDLLVKKAEYREIATVETIAFIDPDAKTLSVSQRIEGGWIDSLFSASDLAVPALDLTIPHAEIFAED